MGKVTTIHFKRATKPITAVKTKFGGQPVWLEKPLWPLSRETGNPMQFIGQIEIDRKMFPNAIGQIAYLFMTNEDVDDTWDPEGGENAVIIQPSAKPLQVKAGNIQNGPTLEDEFEVELNTKEEHIQLDLEAVMDDEQHPHFDALSGNKMGGNPHFIQGKEYPKECVHLLLQLDSTNVPFELYFGDSGTGYLFIDEAATVGKFLWQCF